VWHTRRAHATTTRALTGWFGVAREMIGSITALFPPVHPAPSFVVAAPPPTAPDDDPNKKEHFFSPSRPSYPLIRDAMELRRRHVHFPWFRRVCSGQRQQRAVK
jgi:hypothetical protein